MTITNKVSLKSVNGGNTPIADVPDAPTIGAATNVGTSRAYNNGSATVAYTAAATGGAVTTFTATSTPGSFTGTGSSPITVTGLQSATSYTFTVTPTNSTATGPASSSSSSITATTVPQAPTIGTATNASGQSYTGSASISVPFTAGATGGATVTGYTVTSSSGNTGTGSSSPITVSETVGNPTSTARTYTVTATNGNGTSAASSASNSIAAVSVPQTPTISSATRASNTTVSIAFSGATGGASLSSVTITSSPSVSLSYSGTSSPITVTGTFAQDTAYTFSMTATNSQGTSGTSSASSSVTPYPIPSIGSWSAGTNFPSSLMYMESRANGASNMVSVGGGDAVPTTANWFAYNSGSWSSITSLYAVIMGNLAGHPSASSAQILGGYSLNFVGDPQGQAATYSLSAGASSWTGATSIPNSNSWWSAAIAWGNTDVWSVAGGNNTLQAYYRSGTGAWTTGTNSPISNGGAGGSARGHYAYSRGYSFFKDQNTGTGYFYYQTSAGGAYTATTAPVGTNASWTRMAVVSDYLFLTDVSAGTSIYRYLSNGTSTLMTSPNVSGWLYPQLASAGSMMDMNGGRINGTTTNARYTATVS